MPAESWQITRNRHVVFVGTWEECRDFFAEIFRHQPARGSTVFHLRRRWPFLETPEV